MTVANFCAAGISLSATFLSLIPVNCGWLPYGIVSVHYPQTAAMTGKGHVIPVRLVIDRREVHPVVAFC
jgi:hypothetical protein